MTRLPPEHILLDSHFLSQAVLTHLAGIKFKVLDNAFVMHRAFPKVKANSKQEAERTERNTAKFCNDLLPKWLGQYKKRKWPLKQMGYKCIQGYQINPFKIRQGLEKETSSSQ